MGTTATGILFTAFLAGCVALAAGGAIRLSEGYFLISRHNARRLMVGGVILMVVSGGAILLLPTLAP